MDCRELECLIYIITIVSYLNYRGIRAHQMYHNDEINSLDLHYFTTKKENNKQTEKVSLFWKDIQTKISLQRTDKTANPNS